MREARPNGCQSSLGLKWKSGAVNSVCGSEKQARQERGALTQMRQIGVGKIQEEPETRRMLVMCLTMSCIDWKDPLQGLQKTFPQVGVAQWWSKRPVGVSSLESCSSLGHTMLGLLERAACSKVDVSLYFLEVLPFCHVIARAQVVALAASLTIAQLKSGFRTRMTTEVWTWFFFIPWKKELHRLYQA